ncbi:hypothetical protein SELMODRAFT_430152 [Selaginella moellendorffii]|uniref:ZW10 C-terminal helical domain-containing protein n=1 Tax=Selaginella moellendorffii TaxID=88036 RepID=D8T8I2_SELML|nr:hypothetical protein SELMODRAFT_430152 [Selaginella moellendorffii]
MQLGKSDGGQILSGARKIAEVKGIVDDDDEDTLLLLKELLSRINSEELNINFVAILEIMEVLGLLDGFLGRFTDNLCKLLVLLVYSATVVRVEQDSDRAVLMITRDEKISHQKALDLVDYLATSQPMSRFIFLAKARDIIISFDYRLFLFLPIVQETLKDACSSIPRLALELYKVARDVVLLYRAAAPTLLELPFASIFRSTHNVWQEFLPSSFQVKQLTMLADSIISRIVYEVLSIKDMAAEETVQLHNLLDELILDLGSVLASVEKHSRKSLDILVPSWRKLKRLSELLEMFLRPITKAWESGILPSAGFSPAEVQSLIKAIFTDTSLRAECLEGIV